MKMSAVVQDVTIRASSEGVEQTAASAERLARAGDAAAASGEAQSRSALSVQRAYERLQRQIDLNYRQQQLLEQGQRVLDRALQQTHISAEEHARDMALLQVRYGATAAAVNDNVAPISRFQKATGLAAHDVQNLGFQLNDVAVSLASGQSFFTVMVQQGAQILPILSSAPGGIGGALAGIGRYLVSLVTPATTAAAALALIGTLGVVGLMRFGDEIGALEKSLTGLGRSTPATAAGLSRIAEVAAAQAKVTASAARETAAALASTGQIGLSNFEGLIAISKRFADALNLDAAEANKLLAASFADPVKGADDLNGKLNFLSDATRSYIRELSVQNDQTGAQRVLLDALAPALANATSNTSLLGQAWAYVAAMARGAAEAIAQALRGPTPEQALINARQRLQDISTGTKSWTPAGQAAIKKAEADLIKLEEDYRRTGAAAAAASKAMADDAMANKVSVQAGDIVRALNPLAAKYDELRQKQAVLKQALETPGKLSDPKAAQDAYDAYGRAVASLTDGQGRLISSTELLRQKDELAIAAKKATTDAEKAAIAEKQKSLELIGEVISKEEAARRVAHAGAMERIKDAKAGGSAANDNFDNAMQRSRDQVEELRQQAEQASKTTVEVYRLTEAHRLRRAAIQAGRGDEEGITARIDAQAEAYARQRVATEQAIEAQKRLNDSLRHTGDQLADLAENLLTGDFASAMKSLGRDSLRNSLSAIFTGTGPLAALGGLAPTEKGGVGGIFGTDFFQRMTKAVSTGTEGGWTNLFGSPQQGPLPNGKTLDTLTGSIGNLAGLMQGIGGIVGSYGIGMGAGSVAQAGIGGALSGGLAGLSLAGTGIGASLGGAGVLGPLGLIAGAGLAIYGQQQARQQQKKEQRRQALEAYREAQPQIAQLGSQFRGDPQGTIAQRIAEAETAWRKLGDVAVVAGRPDDAVKLHADFVTYRERLLGEFRASFDGMIDALKDGTGPNSPFASARDSVKSLGDQLKVFVDDTKTAFGADAPQIEQARQAARDYALSVLDGARQMSVAATRMEEIRGASAGLQQVLVDLGMSAEQAAAAISEKTTAALDRLKDAFRDELIVKVNEAEGVGYINELENLFKEAASRRTDASLLGTLEKDGPLIERWLRGASQQVVDSARLTGEAFDRLLGALPFVADYVHEFREELDATAKAADIAARKLAYQDRLFAALNDTSTLEGQLAAFDRTALRDREAEIKAGGEAILDLEAAQAAERFNIIKEYNQKAIDDQKAALREAETFLASFTRNIQQYLDGLRAGSDSPLSPQARLQAAQSQYAAQLALAQGGNRDALNGITGYASDLLDAAKAYYASSSGFQGIFAQIQSQLAALPNQVSAEQLIVNAIDASKTATVGAIDVMRNTLSAAVNSGSASQIASALSTYFNKIDTNTSGSIDFAEMQAALGGMASNSQLRDMFTRLDTDASGSLSRLELIRTATGGVQASSEAMRVQLLALAEISGNTASTANQAAAVNAGMNTSNGYAARSTYQDETYLNRLAEIATQTTRTGYNTRMANARIFANGNAAQVDGYATGGLVTGPGTGTSDSINARLSNGEFVLRKAAVDRFGVGMLDRMNDNFRMPALPVPVMGGGDMASVVAELRRVTAKLDALEREMARNTNVTAAAGEQVAAHVDGVTSAVVSSSRDKDLLAA